MAVRKNSMTLAPACDLELHNHLIFREKCCQFIAHMWADVCVLLLFWNIPAHVCSTQKPVDGKTLMCNVSSGRANFFRALTHRFSFGYDILRIWAMDWFEQRKKNQDPLKTMWILFSSLFLVNETFLSFSYLRTRTLLTLSMRSIPTFDFIQEDVNPKLLFKASSSPFVNFSWTVASCVLSFMIRRRRKKRWTIDLSWKRLINNNGNLESAVDQFPARSRLQHLPLPSLSTFGKEKWCLVNQKNGGNHLIDD